MIRRTSDKVVVYAVLATVALVSAVAFSQPGLAAIGAPFALALFVGLAGARRSPPAVSATVTVTPAELVEGGRVEVRIELRSENVEGRCEVGLPVPAGLAVVDGEAVRAVRLQPGGSAELTVVLDVERWGAYTIGPTALRWREPGGLYEWEGAVGSAVPLAARPARARTRALVRPLAAGSAAGEHTARIRAEGVEFADLRLYVHGDHVGRLNWRASARRGELVVSDHHPDRNTDVVLFIDTFADRGLAETVRIAATLADAYLRRHDRVGLVSFGGVMSWLEPAGGPRQRERLEEALRGAEAFTSFAWKSLERVPRRTLPARCLVLAVTPLVDERARAAVAAMAVRRLDLAVVEVPLDPGAGFGSTWSGDVTLRIHAMQHAAVRDRFLALGVAVVPWTAEDGVETVVREIDEYRRRARVRVRR